MTRLLFALRRGFPRAASAVLTGLLLTVVALPGTSASVRAAPGNDASAASSFLCRVVGAAPAAAARPATELRLALGRLLGEHAYLLMEAMSATATGAPDLDAVVQRLDANTAGLADAMATVYGEAAGGSFATLWQRHIDAAREYATATATGDTGKAADAKSKLAAFRADLDAFLTSANPALDADEEAQAIDLHLEHVTAFAEGDYATAYRVAREAYTHMFRLGDRLARAIARQDPATYPDERVAFSPASELRLTLDRMLGEHLVLAAQAMRASLDQAPNLPAARQALDANSADLSAAVGSVYGDDAGKAFEALWAAHLTAYLDYIDAIRVDDGPRADAARSTLAGYGAVLGEFLAGANPELTVDGVRGLIAHHTVALIAMVDQYRAGAYTEAHATVAEAYEHMFTVGDALAGAIAAQFPDDFDDLEEVPRTDAVAGPPRSSGTGFRSGLISRTL